MPIRINEINRMINIYFLKTEDSFAEGHAYTDSDLNFIHQAFNEFFSNMPMIAISNRRNIQRHKAKLAAGKKSSFKPSKQLV